MGAYFQDIAKRERSKSDEFHTLYADAGAIPAPKTGRIWDAALPPVSHVVSPAHASSSSRRARNVAISDLLRFVRFFQAHMRLRGRTDEKARNGSGRGRKMSKEPS